MSLLYFFISISCVHSRDKFADKKNLNFNRSIAGDESYSDLGLSAEGLKENTLNLDKIKSILIKNKYSRVEQLLEHLSKTDKAYLSYHTFVYDSRSLQSSEYQNPRAIVFGPKANFIFSFNQDGVRPHSATDAIETLSYDEVTKSFSLREIRFKGNAKKDLAEFGGKPFVISEVNPPKCLQCHSNSMENNWTNLNGNNVNFFIRPIWDTYPYWRGVYGGIDDNIISANPDGRRKLFDESKQRTNERREYAAFLAGNRNRGRYSFLPALTSEYDKEMNSALTFLLAKKNFGRIAKRIKNENNFNVSAYRYNLVLSIVCTTGYAGATFSPVVDLRIDDRLKDKYEHFIDKFNQSITAEIEDQNREILSLEKNFNYNDNFLLKGSYAIETVQIAPIMFILDHFGFSTDDWAMRSTIFGKGFGYGVRNYNLMLTSLLEELFSSAEKKELVSLFDGNGEYIDPKFCTLAKQRAIAIK
ncbi:MAG: hypothetical protein IT287_00080 [Bdellovibrionaceae bacterium]|nr:hypothetical protein [Pseudobdellovibrionaceae bacterium]